MADRPKSLFIFRLSGEAPGGVVDGDAVNERGGKRK